MKTSSIDKLASAWFKKADKDLRMAKKTLKSPEDLGDLISFHAQQSVEKYLKGALVFLQIEFSKTHDLKKICLLLQPHWQNMPFSCEEVATLTLYAISTRYPHLWEEVSVEEARRAVAVAKRVREAVRGFLETKGWKDA